MIKHISNIIVIRQPPVSHPISPDLPSYPQLGHLIWGPSARGSRTPFPWHTGQISSSPEVDIFFPVPPQSGQILSAILLFLMETYLISLASLPNVSCQIPALTGILPFPTLRKPFKTQV